MNARWRNARNYYYRIFLAGRWLFRGWPVFFSFFFFPPPFFMKSNRQFLIFIISRTKTRARPSKHSAMAPFLLNTARYGYKLVDRAALTRFTRQRDTTDSLNIFEQSKTRLIPCIKCGTFIGPVVLTRRRSSIVRVFYRSSFFFFFPLSLLPFPSPIR